MLKKLLLFLILFPVLAFGQMQVTPSQQYQAAAATSAAYPQGTLVGTDAAPPTASGKWTALYGLSACQNTGGFSEPNALATSCGQSWSGATWGNDQTSEATIQSLGSAGNGYVNLIVRAASGAKTYYDVEVVTGGKVYSYRWVNGVATQMWVSASSNTLVAGDVWTLQAAGAAITIYKNGVQQWYYQDFTITSGSPAYLQYATGAITNSKVASWHGYSSVQQDGIWTKQGVAIPMVSADNDASFDGVSNPSRILHEGSAQILSGTVYKVMFGCAQNTCYAESTTGAAGSWSRYATPILTGQGFPQIIENGATEYLFTEAPLTPTGINEYTCTNWVSCSSVTTNILTTGAGGTWDASSVFYFTPVYISGSTLYAIYTGGNAAGHYATGYATCTGANFSTCTKYGSNPVASNWWGALPIQVGGTWYGWGQTNQPGQVAGYLDPTESMRMQSPDLINWTNPVHSIHHSGLVEGVNTTAGQAIANSIIDIGGQANLLYGCSPQDAAVPQVYQICLATAPWPLEAIPPQNESATQLMGWDYANRANENPLSNYGHWTTATGQTALKLASSVIEPSAGSSTSCAAIFTGAILNNDQYVSETIGTLANLGYVNLLLRASTSAATWYEFDVAGPTASQYVNGEIAKLVVGTVTNFEHLLNTTPQIGDVYTFSVVGNVLSVYQNGGLIASTVDYSSAISSGYPGLLEGSYGSSNTADAQVTAFSAGNANVIIK
jgi:hypothetical protein